MWILQRLLVTIPPGRGEPLWTELLFVTIPPGRATLNAVKSVGINPFAGEFQLQQGFSFYHQDTFSCTNVLTIMESRGIFLLSLRYLSVHKSNYNGGIHQIDMTICIVSHFMQDRNYNGGIHQVDMTICVISQSWRLHQFRQ